MGLSDDYIQALRRKEAASIKHKMEYRRFCDEIDDADMKNFLHKKILIDGEEERVKMDKKAFIQFPRLVDGFENLTDLP